MESMNKEDRPGAGSIVALGVFDGVHLGHQELIAKGLQAKKELGLPILAVSFHPHPRAVLGANEGYKRLLTPPYERKVLMEEMGVDRYVSIPFTKGFSALSPHEFSQKYLKGEFNSRLIVCGFDFTFGKGGAGGPEDLLASGLEMGFKVQIAPPYKVVGRAVSSTWIRRLLGEGDVKSAGDLLGRPYAVTGQVVKGEGRGRTLGFPTSNLSLGGDKVLPKVGVYVGCARLRQGSSVHSRISVVNVGKRPTFCGKDTRVEVYIPNFAGDLYSKRMQVLFLDRLRDEMRFSGPKELSAQIEKDVFRALGEKTDERLAFNLIGAYDRILVPELP